MEHESQSEASEGLIEASNSYSGSFEYLFNTSEILFEASKTPMRLLCETLLGSLRGCLGDSESQSGASESQSGASESQSGTSESQSGPQTGLGGTEIGDRR